MFISPVIRWVGRDFPWLKTSGAALQELVITRPHPAAK